MNPIPGCREPVLTVHGLSPICLTRRSPSPWCKGFCLARRIRVPLRQSAACGEASKEERSNADIGGCTQMHADGAWTIASTLAPQAWLWGVCREGPCRTQAHLRASACIFSASALTLSCFAASRIAVAGEARHGATLAQDAMRLTVHGVFFRACLDAGSRAGRSTATPDGTTSPPWSGRSDGMRRGTGSPSMVWRRRVSAASVSLLRMGLRLCDARGRGWRFIGASASLTDRIFSCQSGVLYWFQVGDPTPESKTGGGAVWSLALHHRDRP